MAKIGEGCSQSGRETRACESVAIVERPTVVRKTYCVS